MTSFRRFTARFVLFVTILVLALAVAEGGLRIAGYWPDLSSGWMLSSENRVSNEHTISIDPRFLTDETYTPYQVSAPTQLIVTLGDSYTQGVPVSFAEAYPSALEQILQRQSKDVKVLNAGLGDSSPEQQMTLLTKYVLPRVHPDIVIWQFYPNDSLDNATKALFAVSSAGELTPLEARDNWMYRRQRFYERAPLPASFKNGSYLFHLLLRRYEPDRLAAVPKGADPTSWGRQKIPLNISRMQALASQHNFKLYLALVAPQAAYEAVEANTPAHDEWTEYPNLLEVLEQHPNFIHVKFDPATIEAARGNGGGIFSEADRDPNPFGMRHFNSSGYALMAQKIAAGLTEQPFARVVMTPVSRVTFGQPTARKWMRTGWYADEAVGAETYVWSEGERSSLELPLAAGKDLRMTFQCQPLRFPNQPQQTVTVVLNGTVIATVPLQQDSASYSVTLPGSAIVESMNTLEFRYGYARKSLEVQPGSSDTRVLAVAWKSITFGAVNQP
jgi:hypothetical protein